MANSTSNIDTISSTQSLKEVTANAFFDAVSQSATYGRRASTSSGLTWGYYGGNVVNSTGGLVQVSNGTLTLSASATNYIVAAKSSGAVSVSTATTNWDDTANYWRLYSVVTGVSTVSSYTDSRASAQYQGVDGRSYLTNPMTTAGDIIVGGASGTPSRLAIGSNSYVLTMVGGVPTWAAAPGAAGGEVNTASNVGAGTGLFKQKTLVDLEFKSLVAGNGIGLTPGTNEVTIAVTRKQSIVIACSDESTTLTVGAGKVTFRMPYAFTLSGVRASLTTAQTSGSILTVDVNEGGTSILSTKLTIDNGEKTSTTAATAAVISDTALADDAEITIDIDQIGDSTAKGLKVVLIGIPS